jgi:hypothetical protein
MEVTMTLVYDRTAGQMFPLDERQEEIFESFRARVATTVHQHHRQALGDLIAAGLSPDQAEDMLSDAVSDVAENGHESYL